MEIGVFFIALLVAAPFLRAARCQSESQDEGAGNTDDSGDLEIVNGTDKTPFCGDENFSPATGVETVCVFPKNIAKLVSAGEETELLIGIKYDGDSNVNVVAIKASVHLSYDHRMLVENLTAQVLNNASVPPSAQATFPYIFAVSKFLQIRSHIKAHFTMVPFEVVKPSGFLSAETAMLGFALLAARWLWIHCRIQSPSKVSPNKRKAVPRRPTQRRSSRVLCYEEYA